MLEPGTEIGGSVFKERKPDEAPGGEAMVVALGRNILGCVRSSSLAMRCSAFATDPNKYAEARAFFNAARNAISR